MDGVCTDFVGEVCRTYCKDLAEVQANWPKGVYNICSVIGITENHMWSQVDSEGISFWRNMPEYSWFEYLYKAFKRRGDVYFLTTPSRNPFCVAGKVAWMQDRFGAGFRNFILTPHKKLLAAPDRILIDDFDRNVDKFREAGGNAVLFPQIWNTSNKPKEQSNEWYVLQEIDKVIENMEK